MALNVVVLPAPFGPMRPTIDRGGTVTVHDWPAEGDLGDALGSAIVPDGAILGTIAVDGEDRLMVRQPSPEGLHALFLPDLTYIRARGITRSPAAAAFASGPVYPFLGPLPGGGPDGEPMGEVIGGAGGELIGGAPVGGSIVAGPAGGGVGAEACWVR